MGILDPKPPTRAELSATYEPKGAAAAAAAPKLDKTEAVASYRALVRSGNTQTSTYTLTSSDVGKSVEIDAASDSFVIVPSDGGIPVGAEIEVTRLGSGKVRILPEFKNDVWNGSAETTIGGAVPRNGNTVSPLTRVAGAASAGALGLRATSVAAGSFGMFYEIVDLTQYKYFAGDTLTISAKVKSDSGLPVTFTVRFQAKGVTVPGGQYSASPTTNGTVTLSNLVIPASADAILLLTDATATAAGQTQDIDAVIVAPLVTGYVDGYTPGAQFLGAAGNSPTSGPEIVADDYRIPRYGRVILRKRTATQWAVVSPIAPNVLSTSAAALTDRDNGQAGMFAGANVVSQSNVALTSNRLYIIRLNLSRAMVITKVGFKVITASGTDDPVDVAILSSSLVRLVSSGSVTGQLNSAGTKNVTVTATAVPAGTAYLAISATSTATLLFANTVADAFGSSVPALECGSKDSTFPVPSSVTGIGIRDSVPLMWVRES